MIMLLIIFFGLLLNIQIALPEENQPDFLPENSNEPIVVTTYYREPDKRPIFSLIPQYDTKVKRMVTYTGFDKNDLPEVTLKKTYRAREHTIDSPETKKKTNGSSVPLSQEITTIQIFPPANKENTFENSFKKVVNFCKKHKYPLLAATGFSIYCLARLQLYIASSAVYFKNSWSCWRDEIPLEVLYDIQPQEVRAALNTIITDTYQHEIDNLSDSLLIFKKDIHYEMECLQHFIEYYRFLKKTWLSSIFPNYEKIYKRAQEKIDRLMYMEELVEDSMHEKYMI